MLPKTNCEVIVQDVSAVHGVRGREGGQELKDQTVLSATHPFCFNVGSSEKHDKLCLEPT